MMFMKMMLAAIMVVVGFGITASEAQTAPSLPCVWNGVTWNGPCVYDARHPVVKYDGLGSFQMYYNTYEGMWMVKRLTHAQAHDMLH